MKIKERGLARVDEKGDMVLWQGTIRFCWMLMGRGG